MARKSLIPEQIERIKAVFAETGSIAEAARAGGVSKSTAHKYVHTRDEYEQLRTEKRAEVIGDVATLIAEAREKYVRHLMQPDVIASADAKDAATVIGILTDKHQLITGGATARTEAMSAADARAQLAAQFDELAARRKQRATG